MGILDVSPLPMNIFLPSTMSPFPSGQIKSYLLQLANKSILPSFQLKFFYQITLLIQSILTIPVQQISFLNM